MARRKKFIFTHKKRKSKAVLDREKNAKEKIAKLSYLKELYFSPKSSVALSTLPVFYKYVQQKRGSEY